MGAIPNTVRWTLEELGEDFFEPGDVVVHNDPYRGDCHLPEHMMMEPIFLDGELVGFAGDIGHVAEIGGKAPGSFASDATDVYQEGLRLPPVKLVERRRVQPRSVWRDHPGQPPHAAEHLGRLPRHDRRAQRRRATPRWRLATATTPDGPSARARRADRLLGAPAAGRDRRPARRLATTAAMMVEDDGVSTDPFAVTVARGRARRRDDRRLHRLRARRCAGR